MKKYIIKDEKGRLDKVIGKLQNEITRSTIQKMLENGQILVNNKMVKPSYTIKKGDIITIEEIVPVEIKLKAQPEIPLDVIYEDKDILIINKQKGLVVHPGNGNKDGTLVNAIMARCKDSLSGIGGEIRPGIVHRIDKDTSRINCCSKK